MGRRIDRPGSGAVHETAQGAVCSQCKVVTAGPALGKPTTEAGATDALLRLIVCAMLQSRHPLNACNSSHHAASRHPPGEPPRRCGRPPQCTARPPAGWATDRRTLVPHALVPVGGTLAAPPPVCAKRSAPSQAQARLIIPHHWMLRPPPPNPLHTPPTSPSTHPLLLPRHCVQHIVAGIVGCRHISAPLE